MQKFKWFHCYLGPHTAFGYSEPALKNVKNKQKRNSAVSQKMKLLKLGKDDNIVYENIVNHKREHHDGNIVKIAQKWRTRKTNGNIVFNIITIYDVI